MRRSSIVVLIVVVLLLVLAAAGCTREGQAPKPEPEVAPPAIAEAGVLRAGVDLEYPPFAGTDKGKEAGIDIEVARALAARLGLKLELVSVVPTAAGTALEARDADVVFSVPFSEEALASTSLAGSYVSDGPAFFSTLEETITVDTVGTRSIAVQEGSEALWALEEALGPDVVQTFPTLRECIQALADGRVQIVAGDAIVGAYIARDFPNVKFAGQVRPARLVGVAVKKDNTQLADSVRSSLDELAADGVLSAIRRTWVGSLPELQLPTQ